MKRLALLTASVAVLVGCSAKIDNVTVNKLVPQYIQGGDLEMACALGEATTLSLIAIPKEGNPPNRGVAIGMATGAMCAELAAMEFELAAARAEHTFEGQGQIAAIKDARIGAERAHGLAAQRFWKSFQYTQDQFGPVGEECPKLKKKGDELTYMIGLVSGLTALIHDKTAGSPVGVPLDVMPRVARAAECLDDEKMWRVPSALQAGAWATVPGSGPTDVDPWAMLAESADKGDTTGLRLARAMHVLLNANAGRMDEAHEGMKKHGESLNTTPVDEDWSLFDEYARRISLHQSDLVWIAAKGYRTPALGELPQSEASSVPDDPFGADPFGADPFGAPEETAEPSDPPDEESSEEEAPAEENE